MRRMMESRERDESPQPAIDEIKGKTEEPEERSRKNAIVQPFFCQVVLRFFVPPVHLLLAEANIIWN
jgi:hypothetical protein